MKYITYHKNIKEIQISKSCLSYRYITVESVILHLWKRTVPEYYVKNIKHYLRHENSKWKQSIVLLWGIKIYVET